MSCDKRGVSIREEEKVIYILAKDYFAESASISKQILEKLNERKDKQLRIELSSKSKFFSNSFFKFRQAIIENNWSDVTIRTNSRPSFKQMFSIDGNRRIDTPFYAAMASGSSLTIWTTSKRTVFPNDEYTKEMAHLIGLETPKNLKILFHRSSNEKKPEDFQNRVRNLQSFFIRHIEEIPSIENISFCTGSEKNLLASYVRYPECKQLIKIDISPILPVTISEHIDLNKTESSEKQKD